MPRFILPRAALAAFFFASLPATPSRAQAPTPTIGSTKVDVLSDTDGDTKADPNEVIRYNIGISNTGTGSATGMTFTDPTPANTTLIGASVNVSPLAFDDSYSTVGNTLLRVGGSAGGGAERFIAGASVKDNDTDFVSDTPAHFRVVAIVNGASTSSGVVNLNNDGTFTYLPPVGFTGTDTFTYTVEDDGPDDNFATSADNLTNTGTVTITVAGRVWYLVAGGSGDGRSISPSGNPATMSTSANASTDVLYVYFNASALNGAITLESGQQLIGEGVALVAGSTLKAAGNAPTLTNTGGNILQLGTGNNTISGVTLGNRSSSAINGSGFGTLTVTSDVIINGTGQALSLNTGTLSATFASVSASSASLGISLTSIGGTLTMNGGSLTTISGDDFVVNGGTVTVSYAGTITNTAGRSVNISNKTTSGNVTFSGAIADTGTGVLLDNNDGATITFTGGLSLNTGANTAFTATNGGTVAATQNNTSIVNNATSTTGITMNLNGVTIGASGLTFRSVNCSGAANGILLNTVACGSTGFVVVGDGTGNANGSGGTLANITGGVLGNAPVYALTCSGTISLKSINMSLNTNCYSGMLVDNNASGAITVNVTGCTFIGVTSSVVQNKSLLQFEAGNSASQTINVQGSFFSSNRTYGFFTTAAGTSVQNITLNQCGFGTNIVTTGAVNQPGTTITNPPPFSVGITNGSSALVDYTVTNNTFWGADGLLGAIYAVTISGASTTASSHLNGSFNFNKIGKTGVTGSGGANSVAGLGLLPGTQGAYQATVIGNDIRQVNAQGINFFNSAGAGATSVATLKCKGNTIAEPDTTGAPLFQRAIAVTPGNSGGANNPWIAEIGDTTGSVPANKNIISDGGTAPSGTNTWAAGNYIRITNANNTAALTLPGLTPTTGATAAQVNAFVQGANTLLAASVNSTLGTAGINGGAPLPLLFAPGEPETSEAGVPDSMSSAIAWTETVRLRSTAAGAVSAAYPPTATADFTNDLSGRTLDAQTTGTSVLSQTQLDSLVSAARARWAATGLSDSQLAALDKVTFEVADLPGWYLGEAAGTTVRVDSDAGGNGWFIDATPDDDHEFSVPGSRLPVGGVRSPTEVSGQKSEVKGQKLESIRNRELGTGNREPETASRVDLLTTILHEMGHAIGLCDTYSKLQRSSVMYGFLTKGERRLPKTGEATGAMPSAHVTPHFLSSPISIGTLPPGKSLTITYQTTVNGPTLPLGTFEISNQGTVSGSNFANVLTDDPSVGGAADPTSTPVDRPDTTVASINRVTGTPTNAASVSWTVTFADAILSLTTSNFALVNGGLTAPSLTSVTAVGGTPATQWTVTASTGSGSGTLGLNLTNDTGLSHDVTNLTFTGQVYNLDRTPPTVSSVNSTTANGTYKIGDIISIQVNFSETVNVTGTPQITLETGTIDQVVNYTSGSGTSSLTFTYTVQVGDASADLDYQSATALALNGGTITDTVGNVGTLTLASPGAANSLGNNKALVIDGVAPTVASVNSSTANGSYKAADIISIQVNFSEAVTVTGTPQLTLETGATDRVVNYVSGSGTSALTFTYTVQAGDTSADLDYISTTALALNGGTIRDTALNNATLTLAAPGAANSLGNNKAIVIDTTAPTVASVNSSTANGSYKAGDAISIQVNFSEAVTVTGTPQLTLETGATDRVVNYTSGSGTSALTFTYTVQAGDISADLDYLSTTALALNGGTIRDAALNDATLTLPAPGAAGSLGASKNIVIDTTPPAVTSVTSTTADGSYTTGVVIPVTVTFTEAVTVTGTPQLTLETGAIDRVINYTSGTGTTMLTFTYTVQAGDVSADLDYQSTTALALNGGTIRDAALNSATLTLAAPGGAGSLGASKNIVIDTIAPTVTNVTSTAANATYNIGGIIPVTVAFSEVVNVTGTPQLTLETGATDRVVSYTSGTGTNTLTFTYTVQVGDVSADLDYIGTTALALNGGTIRDAALTNASLTLPSPGAAGSLGFNKNIVVNGTAPAVTNVTSAAADGSSTTGAIIPVSVTFSSPVNVTGTPQLTLETGTTDRIINYTSGTGTGTLIFTYTVQAGDTSADLDYQSTTALALNGGTIKDGSGTDALLTLPAPGAAGSLGANKAIVIDTTAPTVTSVNSSTANGSYKAADIISIQVNFSEAVTVTGTPQLTLETGATDRVVNYVSGSGTSALTFTYTVQAGDTSADLDYLSTTALALNGGTIRDTALNNATLTLAAPGAANSLGSNKAIVIDTTVPTVASVNSSTANGSYKAGDAISIQVNFSEAVTVTGTPQLTLETGTTDQVVNYTSGSGTTALTFTYTVQAGDVSADLDYQSTTALALNGGTIRDAALNTATLTLAAPGAANSLGNNKAIVIDTTVPTVASVNSSTANGTYKIADIISIQVTFSEAVTVTGTPQLTLETGTTDQAVNYTSGSGTTTLTFTYTVQAGDVSADLDYQSTTALALNGGTIRDAALNNASLSLATPGAASSLGNNKAIVIDGIAPTATNVTSTAANGSYTAAAGIPVTVTFSETVTVTGTPQLTLETGTTDRVVDYTSGSGTATLTFSYTVQAGDVSVDLDYISATALALNGGSIKDSAGNNAALTLPNPGATGSLGANKDIVLLDVVSLSPTTPTAVEGGATGVYTFTRGGNVGTLTVKFQLDASSTATVTTDYSLGSAGTFTFTPGTGAGTLVIPNSSTSATINLTALTEIPNPAEAAETVKLKIVSDSSYVIGSPADATVTIAPNSFLVTNTNDAGEGSLRQALLNANAIAGTDTITFSDGTAGTTDFFDGTQYVITLSSGELVISSNLTIQGAGAGVLTVSGGTASRVFSVASGTATISGLTIADGNGTGTLDSGNGGGVFNQGTLTLRHCVVLNNNVGATGQGGGVRNSVGTLTLIESTVAFNVAADAGGGVDNASGTLMVISSTISGNASGQSGGGVRISSGSVTVTNSTISGNSAAVDGGGIYCLAPSSLTVYDSTITGNRSDSDGNASGSAGGIGAGGTETLNNTIVAGNLKGLAPEEGQPDTSVPSDVGGGTINTASNNLIGDAGTAGGITHDSDGNPNAGTNNIVGNGGAGTIPITTILDPALSGNGGPTNTHALVFGSPAINAGKNSLLPADVFDLDGDSNTGEPLPVDQRGAGFTRAFGTVDIGAIEIIDYTPDVTPSTTNEDTKTTTGLVISNNASDSGRTTHYQISSIQNGTLFKNDGTTVINAGGFITKAEGAAGLKFLPGADLNSVNTAFFGFSAQAADGTAADDALPGIATVSITVTPQSDNPAASGIPDQLLAVGQARALSLTPFFSDADGDALTFSVFSNSAPGIASAAMNGSNVNLQGLGAGTTLITIRADDGNGGTVDDAFLITVGTQQPTAQQIGSAAAFNPSTGLFEVFVNVTNTTAFRIDGFRLHVNFNAYKPGFPSLRLQNATSPANSADVYVDYRSPVAVGQTVGVKLEFYTSNRQFPSPFMPILTVEYLGWNTSTLSTVANAAPGTRTGAADDRELLYYYKDTAGKISALYWNGTQWAQATLTQLANVSDWLAFDSHYRLLYYQGTDNNLWIVFWTGSQWTQAPITNTGDVAGDVVVDQVWHIVHYRDTGNNVSAVFWNGSQWVQGPLGAPNNNVTGGLAVDSISHLVYYKGTDNQLWAYYYNGAAWVQAQLSMTADVGGGLTADAGGLVYYRSAADNSAWAVYWDGGQWLQTQLAATASMSDATTLLGQNVEIYIDTQGQCRALYFANGQWVTSQLGDGGSNLTGGLSTNAGSSLVFARRSDGHVVVLYYKK